MELRFYSIHQADQIEVYSSSVLTKLKKDSLESSLDNPLFSTDFEKLFNFQLRKGKDVLTNYAYFIEEQLPKLDTPCLFSNPIEPLPIRKKTKGISIKFASLETENDILNFAKEYGLLGILTISFTPNDYGPTVFEPIYFWKHYISEIKNLFKLYQKLKSKHKNSKVDIIGEIIDVKEIDGLYTFKWMNGEIIPFSVEVETNDIDYKNFDEIVSREIFTTLIQKGLKRALDIDFSDISPSKDSEIGFRIKKFYNTNYLLAAIYYDLWQLVDNETEIIFCDYCGKSFTKSGRKKYCNDSCKTLAYLSRKKNS